MNPTLREPEVMEIVPYGNRPSRVGDVVFFLPPETEQPIVHRVVRVTPSGISTLGDNNSREDTVLLQPTDIKGQVVSTWRGRKRREIAGGFQGRLTSRWLHWGRIPGSGVSYLLHPLYSALSRSGLTVRLLPASLRPRVVVFQAQGQEQVRILMGQQVIGRYDTRKRQWQIQRPFRLFVNERMLPERQKKDIPGRFGLIERQRRPVRGLEYSLVLADGSRWVIASGDEEAASVVSRLGNIMQLRVLNVSLPGTMRRLLVSVEAHNPAARPISPAPLLSEADGSLVCILRRYDFSDLLYFHLQQVSSVIARHAQARGGVLLHGALAEREGIGVILAAGGGRGKTTASNRLPTPWRSLCDDTTLVVRDSQGNYWAHAWPTWSRFFGGGSGGSWDVQTAVPLKGIFFLAQALEDRVESIGTGRTVNLLVECAKQTSTVIALGLRKKEMRALHMERFDNLCSLVRGVRGHVLHLSMTGSFWQEIERTLKGVG